MSFLHICDIVFEIVFTSLLRDTAASWAVRSAPDGLLQVRATIVDIVLFSWARHFFLTAPHSTQMYEWVAADVMPWGNPGIN